MRGEEGASPRRSVTLRGVADQLPGWTFVVGKGGVGKTTIAGSLAVELARRKRSTLLASLDPAHSIGDLFDVPAGDSLVPAPGAEHLQLREVDAGAEHAEFLDLHGAVIRTVLDRGTYLDSGEIDEFLGLALPGVDEVGGILFLLGLEDAGFDHVVLDMPPTGHMRRLLEATETFRGALRAMAAMEAKRRSISEGLTGEYTVDEAGRFIVETAERLDALERRLRDSEHTAFVVTSSPGEPVAAETRALVEYLMGEGYPVAAGVGNRGDRFPMEGSFRTIMVPHLLLDPVGAAALRAVAAGRLTRPGAEIRREVWCAEGRYDPPTDRRIYLVAGKGGVGKSTAAAALAFALRDRAVGPVTLLGVDPAGSLADIVGSTGPVAGLTVREMDAGAEWLRMKEVYRERVEALLGKIVGGSDLSADRAVLERIIDLAPPGVDEIIAVGEVAAAIESGDGVYVVDTAPTGHLLRLLAMPEVVREWTAVAMRLLRRYREVVPLGGLGEDLLHLSRRMRTLRAVLSDGALTAIYVITLREALNTPETVRLTRRLAERGMPVEALFWNRTEQMVAPETCLPDHGADVVLPLMDPSPVGPEALRAFADTWTRVRRSPGGTHVPGTASNES